MESAGSTKVRYKGRFTTEKQKKHKIAVHKMGKANKDRKVRSEPEVILNTSEPVASVQCDNRIVNLTLLGKELQCADCDSILSLQDVTKERKRGLGAFLTVMCRHCLLKKSIPISTVMIDEKTNKETFEVNYKLAFGCLHAGIGNQGLNKILASASLPTLNYHTHKTYERKVGPVVETIARESCEKAAKIERELTIANVEEIEKMVPIEHRKKFLIPDTSSLSDAELGRTDEANCDNTGELQDTDQPRASEHASSTGLLSEVENKASSQLKKPSARWKGRKSFKLSTFIVRLMLSFDCAWSKRGNGKNYDSLNGYAALTGTQSGLILDYATASRVCKKCLLKNPKKNHDCRKNFTGSAKAIEAYLALKLATKSDILKRNNLQLGIFCGDEDSSAIAGVRDALKDSHYVVKLSDKNHLSKGVKNLLYSIPKAKDPEKEMNTNVIDYLNKCFSYAMAQNPGNERGLAAALRAIPHHAFNNHTYCTDFSWCKYKENPAKYTHRTIGQGIENPILFGAIDEIFKGLAKNAGKYVHATSSQANESLNAAIARKAPKSHCYSMSESMDYRVAAAVAEKNEGQTYMIQVFERLNLTVDENLRNHVDRADAKASQNAERASWIESKANRIELKKKRNALRHRNERSEGVQYQSQMGLITTPVINQAKIIGDQVGADMTNEEYQVVFFDLETSGLSGNCDILQIAAGTGSLTFNSYIKPSKPIDAKATDVHGLTNVSGDLHLHGVPVQSLSLPCALTAFISYLQKCDKKCILVAHNLAFDGPRLLRSIEKYSLLNEFQVIVSGFVCSLEAYKKKMKITKSKKGELKLSTLARAHMEYVDEDQAHNASYDVELLRHFACKVFTVEDIVSELISVPEAVIKYKANKQIKDTANSLSALSDLIPTTLRQKMAEASVAFQDLINAFEGDGNFGVIKLLKSKIRYKPRSFDLEKTYIKIAEYFEKLAK